jgi:diguanylate cyclase (GGDEF)-like protein
MNSSEKARGELRERFYRSVAETLALLHSASGHERNESLLRIARILASSMDLPLVWIGRREVNQCAVNVLSAAGPATDYANSLRLSSDESQPGGRGPVAIALRQGYPRAISIDAQEFSPWRDAARQHGFGACIVAVSTTRDGGQLVLAAYSRDGEPSLNEEFIDWAQRLADELSRHWDHQALVERSTRMSRYRDAQRTIQRGLLEQPDPEAVYQTLAGALADIAGAAAVDVFAADGADDRLRRVALVGPMSAVMADRPLPAKGGDGSGVSAATLAYMGGVPVVHRCTDDERSVKGVPRNGLLECGGAVGCWPLFAEAADPSDSARRPVGIFVVMTVEPEAFDDEMCRLLDEIADAASLALRQHAQRQALIDERERQRYLALHDDLTDLPNRRALDLYLETALARPARQGRKLAVGLLDLDDLKVVNDRHGHAVGDRLLMEVATRLRLTLRAEDYVARLGGDEFVLVFDNIEDEAVLEGLVERVARGLLKPVNIEELTLPLAASLGIAVHSAQTKLSGEQLLRLADQAMYTVKARKRDRGSWWVVARNDGTTEASDEVGVATAPYGDCAARFLSASHATWESQLPGLVEGYCHQLLQHEGIAALFAILQVSDLVMFKRYLAQHLQTLMRPDLDSATHRAGAARAGTFHATCGLEEVWLLECIEMLRELLATHLSNVAQAERGALVVLVQRLGMERQWQLESMRELQRRRVVLLARVNALAWSAESYLQLIQGVVDILILHSEFVACVVGRPDALGALTYEAVAGSAFAEYLRVLAAGEARPIRVNADRSEGEGSGGRAWRTSSIQRCAHFATDPRMAVWREVALRVGVVSNVVIPLCPSPHQPLALLTLYSAHVGGLQSEDQRAFVEQLKTVLDLALARLAPPRQGAELLPFIVRERWRERINSDALQMHYQPLVRLADGQVAEFEALARLCDDDATLLSPARFLPALGSDDLVVMFRRGLTQAVACRQWLQRAGHSVDMSVNVPAAALADPRYANAAGRIITDSGCPPQALLLEILESPIGTEHSAPLDEPGMHLLKALGVRLVEDDLGAGYSSLIRLRQWPFDRIKIDQAIVGQATRDPLGTLRFVRQLIRIGHDLALEVVVEGLESLGLIEAAAILGADFGQGYALARPMPPESLLEWLADFRPQPHVSLPRTGLGALAAELRWEEQLIALPEDPGIWRRHAQADGDPGDYLRQAVTDGISLLGSREAMRASAIEGPANAVYRQRREDFLSLLIAHIVGEDVRATTAGE